MTFTDLAFTLFIITSLPAYFLTLELVAGLLPYKAKRHSKKAGSCAIIIPAHNEEITLGATLASIKEQISPDDRIIVIADNCTDSTAAIATRMGVEVLERFDSEKRGKGYALAYAINHLQNSPVDIVMFVDADCRAEPGSIATLKSACATYENPVQSRYQFYAPHGAPPARTISEFALYIKNHVRLLGLHRLGGSVPITGSGFAMPFGLLRHFDLNTGNIVEDMKLGVDIALHGNRVMYVPEAQISTSLPLSNADAHKQRTRWEHGHITTILRYCPKLLAAAIRRFSKTQLLTALDLTVPPIFVLLTIGITIGGIGLGLGYALSDERLAYVALTPIILILAGLAVINWQAKIVSLRQLPDIFIYAVVKVDIYRKFLAGENPAGKKPNAIPRSKFPEFKDNANGWCMRKKKVLLIMEQCNPDWASVPLVGYRIYQSLAKIADVTLVTHDRNRAALQKIHANDKITYMVPSKAEKRYYSFLTRITTFKGRVIWPLFHAFYLPIYLYFDKAAAQHFGSAVANGEYDVVHVITPIQPRFPVAISRLCGATPFILGPVNGGVPFPDAFKSRGRREFSQLNFIRTLGRILLPGYRRTYKDAALVIAGSTYTRDWVHHTMKVPLERLPLIWENGVTDDFYISPTELNEDERTDTAPLKLIFCGRLEPYKGADMLIKAVARVRDLGIDCRLTIVGAGSEMATLKELVTTNQLNEQVTFTGWIDQSQTRRFYQEADVFAFPSVREFGGAVVMEAMACGLPCIVVDNGGIAEYVDDTSGFRIPPHSEQFVIEEMARHISIYANNRRLLKDHSLASRQRAEQFRWARKANEISGLYDTLQATCSDTPQADTI